MNIEFRIPIAVLLLMLMPSLSFAHADPAVDEHGGPGAYCTSYTGEIVHFFGNIYNASTTEDAIVSCRGRIDHDTDAIFKVWVRNNSTNGDIYCYPLRISTVTGAWSLGNNVYASASGYTRIDINQQIGTADGATTLVCVLPKKGANPGSTAGLSHWRVED